MPFRIVRTRSEPLSIFDGETRVARIEMPYPGDRTAPATPTVSGAYAQRIVEAVNAYETLRAENARLRVTLAECADAVTEMQMVLARSNAQRTLAS